MESNKPKKQNLNNTADSVGSAEKAEKEKVSRYLKDRIVIYHSDTLHVSERQLDFLLFSPL